MLNSIIIFFAEYLYLLIILIAAIYFFTITGDEKKKFIIFTLIALPCIYIISRVASYFYFDPRPFVAGNFTPLISHIPDNGFPSDHALLTSAISAILFYFNKKVSLILWIITVLVGTARVMAGVHHAVDIIGSIFISIIITFIINSILTYNKK